MSIFSLTLAPLNSSVSVPSWPSTVSLPSPGFQTNVSSPAPSRAVSLPRPPVMMSLPSPPSSMSLPSPPVIVSLPAPPSTVSWMRLARPLPAVMTSSPPLALRTRFSVVPMSRLNGAGLTRSKRTRVPLAVIVKVSAPLPPLTSTVSMPSPPSMRSLPSPGFQIIRSLPASPKTWSSPVAAGQHVVAGAAEQQVVAALAEQGVVAGLAEEQVVARAAGERVVAVAAEQLGGGSAPLVSSSVMVSLPPWPNTWIKAVLATVGVPP